MPTPPLDILFCYAPQDEELKNALEAHLAPLSRQGYITGWSSRKLGLGADRRAEIEQRTKQADLILLLVSADLLASESLVDPELGRALQKRPEDVMGVLLRPCDWKHGDLARIEVHPRQTPQGEPVPVTGWANRDEAFTRVAERLRERAQQRTGRLSGNPRQAHPIAARPG
jgi:hypothetical protein